MKKMAMVCNVLIDSNIKYEFFCTNFNEIHELFEEFHIKIRGNYAEKVIDNCNKKIKNKTINYYQNLSGKSYVKDLITIVKQVKSDAIFLFFEDYRLMCELDKIKEVLNYFLIEKIDYMPYVGKTSRGILSIENILPLKPIYKGDLGIINIDYESIEIMTKILNTSYIFTLPSVVSKKYLISILESNNKIRLFVNFKWINSLLLYYVGWPRNIKIISKINKLLGYFKIKSFINPINSPHDLEIMAITGMPNGVNKIRIGLSKVELFSNWDDDYGVYGSSLIQRGLFPYGKLNDEIFYNDNKNSILAKWELILKPGEDYNIQYHNRRGRINSIPVLKLKLLNGCCWHTSVHGDKILQLNREYYFLTSLKQSIVNKSNDIAVLSLSINEL